ncbi:40S ribosomal protein S1-like [Helianthus annuus]|uniref:40S ribosomal protein S1-like n=1 Tax=Helianthus annuus TaxID=4232 RepID=UPI000B8FAB40|nr:40S ribosomal protein S1-like [Helianthus annuus]
MSPEKTEETVMFPEKTEETVMLPEKTDEQIAGMVVVWDVSAVAAISAETLISRRKVAGHYLLHDDAGFGNIIIVDNLPIVRRERFEKLEGVVRKIYSQIGIRRKMREIMVTQAQTCDLKQLVQKFIPESIGREIEKATSSIYPLQNVFIRKA